MARFTGTGGGSGVPGPTGPEGDSAYEVAVANGFVGTEQEWLDSLSSNGVDIADFIFTDDSENTGRSIISLPGDKGMTIQAGEDSDLYLTAGDDVFIQTLGTGDDIHLNAADDIRFSAGEENETAYFWRMDSEGLFQLPGDGYISNPIDSSGDPSTPYVDTIHLVPDGSLESNQYIILDPTAPNHIHIRAGGNMDESSADLILGGEKNNVVVSDSTRDVFINTRPDMIANTYVNVNEVNNTNFITIEGADIQNGYTVNVDGTDYIVDSVTLDSGLKLVTALSNSGQATFTAGQSYTFTYNPEYTNSWEFGSNGYLYGPAEGGLKVLGISNPGEEQDVFVTSGDKVLLNGTNGEFLNDATVPDNQIATIGHVASTRFGASASYYSTADQGPVTVNTPTAFTFNNTDWQTGVALQNTNEIVMTAAGKYNIAFSAQLHQTNGSGVVNIWLNKNGTPLANTNTKIAITANNPFSVAAWNLFVDAAANDTYQLVWSSTSPNTVVEYEAQTTINGFVHPAIPSVILTVNQVG